VRIAGDVQLAAEVQWLVDHVRWDLEEDLSRIIGDAPAHTAGQVVRRMADGVRQFVARGPAATPASATTPPTTPATPSAPGQAGG
jgi:ubiquinone biosynthesis protein UbiJ